jgi:hypothetical protein
VEQPVGLLLDKSKGLALGSELVTNGDFSSNTWWSTGGGAAISGGALNFTAAVTTSGAYRLGFATVGKYYELTFEIISISSGGVQITLGTSSGTNRTAAGVYTQRILCTGNGNLTLYSVGASTTASVDNVSIKEVQGNHASQSTAASRPVLSARVNLLTYTEQFDNAAWSKLAGWAVGPTPATDPIGGLTADAIIPTAGTTLPYTLRAVTVPAVDITMSYYIKQGTSGQRWVQLVDANHTNGRAWFDLTNGVPGTKQSGISTSSITPVGTQGWFLVKVTLTKTNTSCEYVIQPAAADNNAGTTILWNGTDSAFFLWGADIRPTNVGSNMPVYQRVGAATYGTSTVAGNPDYDTTGFPFFLAFNGSTGSRWMVSSTITPGTDKAQVFAGVRKLGDTFGVISEFSAEINSNSGAFIVNNYTDLKTYFASKGTAYQEVGGTAIAAPFTEVFTGLGDISAPLVSARENGALSGSKTASQGTGNYLSYPLYIGARAGTISYYNGNLYSLIVRFGTNLPESTIDQTEVWVGDKTGLNLNYATQQTIFDRFNATVLDRAGATILQRY